MTSISKDDKRIWENYVSNLEKYILFPKNDGLLKNKIVNNNHTVRRTRIKHNLIQGS